jgi:hypothetical protein
MKGITPTCTKGEASMRKRSLLFALVLAGSVAGCSQQGNFEGKWVAGDKSHWDGTKFVRKLEIKRNGENFLLYPTMEQYRDTGRTVGDAGKNAAWSSSALDTVSATVKDGKLMVNPVFSYTYVKGDGTVLGPEGEVYKRETIEEFNKLKKEASESYKEKNPKTIIEQ